MVVPTIFPTLRRLRIAGYKVTIRFGSDAIMLDFSEVNETLEELAFKFNEVVCDGVD